MGTLGDIAVIAAVGVGGYWLWSQVKNPVKEAAESVTNALDETKETLTDAGANALAPFVKNILELTDRDNASTDPTYVSPTDTIPKVGWDNSLVKEALETPLIDQAASGLTPIVKTVLNLTGAGSSSKAVTTTKTWKQEQSELIAKNAAVQSSDVSEAEKQLSNVATLNTINTMDILRTIKVRV